MNVARLLAGLFAVVLPALLPAQDKQADSQEDPEARVLYSIKPDGTERQFLYELDDFDTVSSPAVSSDGRLAFAAWNQAEGETRSNSQVFYLTLSNLGALTSVGDGAMPSWSPRARRIAFTRFTPNVGVWVMKTDGLKKVLLDRRGSNALWSPNGHRIGYVKTVQGARTIAIYDMVEDRSIELWEKSGSPYGVISGGFAWSPDSRRICLRGRRLKDNGQDLADDSEIAIVSVTGSSKPKVYDTFHDGTFPSTAWSPDGNRIVFSKSQGKDEATQLFSFDPTSEDKPVLFPGQDGTRNNASPCWALDGSLLIYASAPVEETNDISDSATSSTDD